MKESKAVTEEWERGKIAPVDVLVPAALREQIRRDTLHAFGLKAWQVGLAPAPWHARVRGRVNRARQRTAELAYRLIAGHDVPGEEW